MLRGEEVEEKANNRREKEKSDDEKEKDAQGSKKMILKIRRLY